MCTAARTLAAFLLLSSASAAICALSPAISPTPKSNLCNADFVVPTDADDALERNDFATAEALFRSRLTIDPSSEDAHLGLIRALIGEDNLAAARREAAHWLTQSPTSTLAEIAAGEAAFHDADIAAAHDHANNAITADHCEGRALALAADLSSLDALFAREANLIHLAHQLRPHDELIRRSWIFSLPLAERTAELTRYLDESTNLSAPQRALYTSEISRLKAHHPGECRVTSPIEAARVPFKRIDTPQAANAAYGLDVAINGVTRRLEIDTGASGILLSHSVAKKLGLHPEHHFLAAGIGDYGNVGSYLTHVASIRIGVLEFSDCLVEVLDESRFNGDGLIGPNIFAPWLVTLDYPHDELRVAPLPPRPRSNIATPADDQAGFLYDDSLPSDRYIAPEMQDWLRVLRIGHLLLVPTSLDQGPPHYFIADTGSIQTTISLDLAKTTRREYIDPSAHLYGVSGPVNQTFRVDNAVLRFGEFRLPPASYDAFDFNSLLQQTGFHVSGLLGLPTLSMLTIKVDYRDNLMQLVYGPKRNLRN